MTFTQAALIVAGLAAVALALTTYHLLSRLEMLERAVMGGFEAPSRRLGREEFAQRFDRAVARHRLAREVGTGLVLVLGAEFADGELAGVLANLGRADGVTVIARHPAAEARLAEIDLPGLELLDADPALGVAITPFAMVIDDRRVTAARPVAAPDDLLALLHDHT